MIGHWSIFDSAPSRFTVISESGGCRFISIEQQAIQGIFTDLSQRQQEKAFQLRSAVLLFLVPKPQTQYLVNKLIYYLSEYRCYFNERVV